MLGNCRVNQKLPVVWQCDDGLARKEVANAVLHHFANLDRMLVSRAEHSAAVTQREASLGHRPDGDETPRARTNSELAKPTLPDIHSAPASVDALTV